MNVLVAYASAHGSTREIAHEIGEHLRSAGLEVDVRQVDEVDSVRPYAAVLVGSAVHDGAWLESAYDFVGRERAELTRRAVWLFSVSSLGDTSSFFSPGLAKWMRRHRPMPTGVDRHARVLRAEDHHDFAGVIEKGQWSRLGDLFLRVFGGKLGDHRDHADIGAWADGIAATLKSRANV